MSSLIFELKMYLRKGEILLDEARSDLQIGNYNKSVSASYFAVEAYANVLFLIKKQKVRGYRGRINVIRSLLDENYAELMEKLHDLRNSADHRCIIMNKSDAESALKIAELIINAIISKIKEIVPEVFSK